MDNIALKIDNLVKSYGEVKAVNGISFEVAKGSLFAFLGINGAGKSTTINIICSILQKDGGKIFVSGKDLDEKPSEIKRDIGIVFQTSVLDKELTVKQNLEIRTSFYGLSKEEKKRNIAEIIELLDLQPILNRIVGKLSGGQMRRVDIARAMVHRPKLLILDEPTTGLDPKTRINVWALIDKIRQETGMTVFLTTHYLEEAEKATDVVIMDKGNIIAHGTPNELKNKYSSDSLYAYMDSSLEFEKKLSNGKIKFDYNPERGAYRISVANTDEAKQLLADFGGYLNDIELVKGNMDDVFLNVTGKDIKILGESEND
ncbi:MAG: ATP-binding cassette domain-containing protein [Clostridia bacterium]|nr:ATP-binding cassette domain-containing protein [Clostridia bacterium]